MTDMQSKPSPNGIGKSGGSHLGFSEKTERVLTSIRNKKFIIMDGVGIGIGDGDSGSDRIA
ncbi:hypothetical protein PHYBLDRAFT_138893 [Phycomyces blakesleeanus NRRL 1555(-)]|uniref:Uncharacterized protein n=1 Tax=Phycomyces blakesleeanus (strain ATCC 8743b / DSM 1359 / FGSC 10004 / NBRC 33097 / NRRL 1555) TaxID=763407 RepID=A0A162YKL7_PHYB8|nr:hypothetical protein PHYBLDRAFT_138893 [Phycomyces blakesleeanus NRRL 1555(-)]OAD81345.1 hypothetical protein PHYBLDRAFT_138893 [Phycomyces blakesleeanus NRRL 1555(-)]|eukprot:XP_018299385.1 hypothetical protein PHYBLDRAFT_138893 [Phycomyces blakesleeanus NRRL 1555(-)]